MLKQICKVSGLLLLMAMLSMPVFAQNHLIGDGSASVLQARGGHGPGNGSGNGGNGPGDGTGNGPGDCAIMQPETPQEATVIAQQHGNRNGGGAGKRGKGGNGGVCLRS